MKPSAIFPPSNYSTNQPHDSRSLGR